MCHQSFQHFQCEHSEIVEHRCANATGHPFFLLVACENYTTTSTLNRYGCGLGKYYCAKSPDAGFLDLLYRLHVDLTTKLVAVEKDFQIAEDNLTRAFAKAESLNLPKHVFLAHPDYHTLARARDQHAELKRESQQMLSDVIGVIQQTQYYIPRLLPGQRLGYDYTYPLLQLPNWMSTRLASFAQASPRKSIEQVDPSSADVEMLAARPTPALTPYKNAPIANAPKSVRTSKRARATPKGKDVGTGMAGGPFIAPSTTPSVRRSTRARQQPVSYAEYDDEDDEKVDSPLPAGQDSLRAQVGIKRGLDLDDLEVTDAPIKKLRLRPRVDSASELPSKSKDAGDDDFAEDGEESESEEENANDDWHEGME